MASDTRSNRLPHFAPKTDSAFLARQLCGVTPRQTLGYPYCRLHGVLRSFQRAYGLTSTFRIDCQGEKSTRLSSLSADQIVRFLRLGSRGQRSCFFPADSVSRDEGPTLS